jgi:integrase
MHRKRKSSSQGHPVLDGRAIIRRTKASGDYWQFVMWVSEERATYRKSLRTTDFDSAMEAAQNLCLDLLHRMRSGKKLFGMSLGEVVTTFIEYKRGDVDGRFITRERLISIRSYLKPFVRFKGSTTLIGELDRKAAFDYARWRRGDLPTIKDETIKNEQSTINMMAKFAYREGYIGFEQFQFAPLRIPEVRRRDTFTDAEFVRLHRHMSKWALDHRVEQKVSAERYLIRACIEFSGNSMLRVGECRQLLWKDVLNFEHQKDELGQPIRLVTIQIRAETCKTRKFRKVTVQGGHLLEGLQKRTPNWRPEGYIFCGSSDSVQLSEKRFNAVWAELMAAIGIDYKKRNLTYTSLRHFAITRLLTAGVPIWAVAKTAGTTATYIEKHYGHVDQKLSRDAALAMRKATKLY